MKSAPLVCNWVGYRYGPDGSLLGIERRYGPAVAPIVDPGSTPDHHGASPQKVTRGVRVARRSPTSTQGNLL